MLFTSTSSVSPTRRLHEGSKVPLTERTRANKRVLTSKQAEGKNEGSLRSPSEQDSVLPAVPQDRGRGALPDPVASPCGGGQASVCCPGGCSRGTCFHLGRKLTPLPAVLEQGQLGGGARSLCLPSCGQKGCPGLHKATTGRTGLQK